jgi:hypothetical protein
MNSCLPQGVSGFSGISGLGANSGIGAIGDLSVVCAFGVVCDFCGSGGVVGELRTGARGITR